MSVQAIKEMPRVKYCKDWEEQKEQAREGFVRSRRAYYERNGMPVFDRERWEEDKEEAKKQAELKRREKLDAATIARIHEITVSYNAQPGELTRAQAAILVVLVELAANTTSVWASEATIAKLASVCRRSVTYALNWLEEELVLIRRGSGGYDLLTGKTKTNVYSVNYEQLREFLGMDMVPTEYMYAVEQHKVFQIAYNPFEADGYRRYSNTDTSNKKKEQRAKTRNLLDFVLEDPRNQGMQSVSLALQLLYKSYDIPVEKRVKNRISKIVEIISDQFIYQGFCALNKLKNYKILNENLAVFPFGRPSSRLSPSTPHKTILTYNIDSSFLLQTCLSLQKQDLFTNTSIKRPA